MPKKTSSASGGRQVKAILPEKFQKDALLSVLKDEMHKYAPFLVSSFQRTVRFWKREKPIFTPVFKVTAVEYSIQIRLTGSAKGAQKWKWLDLGTKRHRIAARNAPRLRYRKGYRAGSRANSTFTIAATPARGAWRSPKEVMHPGFPARNWDKLIAEEHLKPFTSWMNAALGNAAHASKHEVQK